MANKKSESSNDDDSEDKKNFVPLFFCFQNNKYSVQARGLIGWVKDYDSLTLTTFTGDIHIVYKDVRVLEVEFHQFIEWLEDIGCELTNYVKS